VTGRRFVLVPLLDLDPHLALPDGTALSDALGALGPGERVDRYDEPEEWSADGLNPPPSDA
jgi:hypothetical protein